MSRIYGAMSTRKLNGESLVRGHDHTRLYGQLKVRNGASLLLAFEPGNQRRGSWGFSDRAAAQISDATGLTTRPHAGGKGQVVRRNEQVLVDAAQLAGSRSREGLGVGSRKPGFGE